MQAVPFRSVPIVALLLVAFTRSIVAQTGPGFGYTRPAAEVKLAFPETGVLREVNVTEGREVKKGEVLARLDSSVLEAEAEMTKAQADLAARRLKSLEQIADSARVSPDELARARAEAAIEAARVKRVAAQLENRVLRSPVDGIVTEVRREVGENVGLTDPHVLTIVRIAELRADLYVPVAVASAHKAGESIDILYDGKVPLSATIEFISPLVEPASGATRMKLLIPNADGKLSSGMKISLAPFPGGPPPGGG
ncbi:MAG: efflux RND transporter periplasmic adaptor subunit [Planctomycetes bacterium]|nr:efflux RND transporter periplasmic adaptor subunit [Planctomycetota bacterium]